MSRNSKAKRDAKKKKALKQRNTAKPQKSLTIGSDGPTLSRMENPFANLSDEQRSRVITEISQKSIQSLPEKTEELFKTFEKYCPLTILSIIASYSLTQGIGEEGVVNRESPLGLEQYHVELLQAFFLKLPQNQFGQDLPTSQVIQTVMELLKDIQQSFTFSRLDASLTKESEEIKAINQIQELLRGHTQVVRNWGFNSQIRNISTEMYSEFDTDLIKEYGFSATDAIQFFTALISVSEEKQTRRFDFIRDLYISKNTTSLFEKYSEYLGLSDVEKAQFSSQIDIKNISVKNLFMMILSHNDTLMPLMFNIDAMQIAQATGLTEEKCDLILELFSFKEGALENHNVSHIFLDNPVWTKPILAVQGTYYCVLPQLFFSFILDSLDELVEPLNKSKLHDCKANYLENKIEEIAKTRFPDSLTLPSIQWDFEGKIYETDLVTFIDSHAIIIEAKSHKVTKPALRGAPDRIKRHLKNLYIEPSIQSFRFEEKLRYLIENPNVEDPLRSKLPVNLSDINEIIRVSVSLEDFATLQTNIRLFDGTGWLPSNFKPCPSMNLADFQTLFDLLEHPVQIINYLQCRDEIQQKYELIGDELDYMGMYLETFLALGNFAEYAHDHTLNISGMSTPIDNYYQSKDAGEDIPKPQPKTSKWFKQIFSQLEKRSTPRWTEIGSILNRIVPSDQKKLDGLIIDFTKIVNRTWEKVGHKNMIILCPHETSEYALAIVLYKDSNSELRDQFIHEASFQALEPNHVKQCLLIAKNIDKNDLPYHFIGLMQEPNV